MELLGWRIRISALWLVLALNYVAYVLFPILRSIALWQPATQATVEAWRFTISAFFCVHCIMIWLSLILKNTGNRWANVILGILFAGIKIAAMIGTLIVGGSPAIVFNAFWGFAAAGLIVWYAWKMPKQEA